MVSEPHGDEQLRLIADTIDERFLVDDLDGLGAVLDRQTAAGPRALALIGHSTPPYGRLKLGQTEIAADDPRVLDFFARRRDQLAALGITTVHLLGCYTAHRAESLATMKALAAVTGLPVLGTTILVSATSYDAGGFKASYTTAYLVDHDHPPSVGGWPLDDAQASGTAGALEVEALETVTLRVTSWPLVWPRDQRLSRLLPAIVDQTGHSMPGLLVEPDLELLIPTGSGFRRVDVILGGAAVRVFPGEHPCGIVYRVVEPGPLRSLVGPYLSTAHRAPSV